MTVVVRLEFDRLPIFAFVFDREAAATILRVTLRIANVQHFVERNWRLSGGLQLVDLAQDLVNIMEVSCSLCRTGRIQLLAGLDHQ